MGSVKDEIGHTFDEAERISDLLKKHKPENDQKKKDMDAERQLIEEQIMDEDYMRGLQIDMENANLDLESMKLDLRETERIYGEHQARKDSFYKRRETKSKLKSQGGVKKSSPLWDDED